MTCSCVAWLCRDCTSFHSRCRVTAWPHTPISSNLLTFDPKFSRMSSLSCLSHDLTGQPDNCVGCLMSQCGYLKTRTRDIPAKHGPQIGQFCASVVRMSQAHGKSMAIPFGRGTPWMQKGLLPCRLSGAAVTLHAREGGSRACWNH